MLHPPDAGNARLPNGRHVLALSRSPALRPRRARARVPPGPAGSWAGCASRSPRRCLSLGEPFEECDQFREDGGDAAAQAAGGDHAGRDGRNSGAGFDSDRNVLEARSSGLPPAQQRARLPHRLGQRLCHRRRERLAPVDALGLDAQQRPPGRQAVAGAAPCPADRSVPLRGRCAGGCCARKRSMAAPSNRRIVPGAPSIFGGIEHQHRMGRLDIGQQTEAQRAGIDEVGRDLARAPSAAGRAAARRRRRRSAARCRTRAPARMREHCRAQGRRRRYRPGDIRSALVRSSDVTIRPSWCFGSITAKHRPAVGSVRFRTDGVGAAELRSIDGI